MLRRCFGAFVVATLVGGFVLAEDTRGTVVKVEDGSITVRRFGAFGKDEKAKSAEKVFKVSKDVKVTKVAGKDKGEVRLTLDELRTAVKVTNVVVTVSHDGDNASEIRVGLSFGNGGKDKGKGKKDDK